MARVNQISVSAEERFPVEAPPVRGNARTFSVAVTLRAEYEEHGGPLLEQIGRLQNAARRAVNHEREQIFSQIEREENEDHVGAAKSRS